MGSLHNHEGEEVVIVDGVRTPFCKAGTSLASLAADELGRQAVNALLARTALNPALIDEVIFGCVSQPADASNIARVIALRSGVPKEVPALTVSRNCASGFEAITEAYIRIRAGRGSVYLVGGTESMSQVPFYFSRNAARKFSALAKSKTLWKRLTALKEFGLDDFKPMPGLRLGLTDPVCGLNMGETAEILAREFDLSREVQDTFAVRSHQRAVAGRELLAAEICPVFVLSAKGCQTVTVDNGPRDGQSTTALAALKPAFDRGRTGFATVTAGNSSQISDGAVALLVMTRSRAEELGFAPLGRLVDFAYVGCDPSRMGLGPVAAIHALQARGFSLANADLIEINEAFAAQVLAVLSELKEVDGDRFNVNGGAIAIGHPVGATGARLVLTALLELRRRGGRSALVSACVGGGQGGALWLERT